MHPLVDQRCRDLFVGEAWIDHEGQLEQASSNVREVRTTAGEALDDDHREVALHVREAPRLAALDARQPGVGAPEDVLGIDVRSCVVELDADTLNDAGGGHRLFLKSSAQRTCEQATQLATGHIDRRDAFREKMAPSVERCREMWNGRERCVLSPSGVSPPDRERRPRGRHRLVGKAQEDRTAVLTVCRPLRAIQSSAASASRSVAANRAAFSANSFLARVARRPALSRESCHQRLPYIAPRCWSRRLPRGLSLHHRRRILGTVGTWRAHAPKMHALALLVVAWGIVLVSAQALPRSATRASSRVTVPAWHAGAPTRPQSVYQW